MLNQFMRAEEVARELEVSKSYAYKLIQQLNAELREKGYITIAGRVNGLYLNHFQNIRTQQIAKQIGIFGVVHMTIGIQIGVNGRIRLFDLPGIRKRYNGPGQRKRRFQAAVIRHKGSSGIRRCRLPGLQVHQRP